MSIKLPDARTLSDKELETLRLRAINGCERGFREGEIADILGVARETVCRWWTDYKTRGIEAITPRPRGPAEGTGASLSQGQAQKVQEILDSQSPGATGGNCDRGRDGRLVSAAPPSEPDRRFSRIRLSG
jgi:transposase